MIGMIDDGDGAAAGVVSIVDETLNGANGVACSISYENDGDVSAVAAGGLNGSTWVAPDTADIAAGYQIHVAATGDTGSLTGTLDTWLDLSTTRTWQLAAPGEPDDFAVSLTVQIRDKFSQLVRDSATVTLGTGLA